MKPTNLSHSIHYLFAIILLPFLAFSEDSSNAYNTLRDVSYYSESTIETDEYIAERCKLDLYYPVDSEKFPTVVWFHGGGLRSGDRYVPRELQERQIAVVAVDYRLFPRAHCPAYLNDAAAAVAWTMNHIEQYGGDPSLVFVSGHSAGAYLASMIGLDKQYLNQHNVDANDIAAYIPLSGHTITHFTIREERGIDENTPVLDAFAPLAHIRADAPPFFLVTGDRELELWGRYEENAYFQRMMKNGGHKNTSLDELQGFDHGAMVEPGALLILKYIKEYQQTQDPHLGDQ